LGATTGSYPNVFGGTAKRKGTLAQSPAASHKKKKKGEKSPSKCANTYRSVFVVAIFLMSMVTSLYV